MPCLLDSDTLSELSRGNARVIASARAYMEEHGRLAISVFERLRGYHAALRAGRPYERQLEAFMALQRACHVLPVDSAIAERAATYWAQLPTKGRSALGDILIAATAATSALVLVTRNRSDFEPIARLDGDLQLTDWSR